MGGWGAGSFENDHAQKFLVELGTNEPEDLKVILAQAADHEGYLEAPESSVAIVTAEVVAAAKGNPASSVPAGISEWIGRFEGAPSSEMTELARRVVERVRLNSELKDLWLEAEGLNEWSAVLRDLEGRLGS
jgi:citrate synthase